FFRIQSDAVPQVLRPARPAARGRSIVSGCMKLTMLLAALGAALAQAPGAPQGGAFDVVIRHGTVLDGTGLAAYPADVAIAGDRIAAIGDLSRARAARDIDATGLYVAPGFINIHSHAAANALPTAENMLTQGVTTEIVNADGGGFTDIAQQLTDTSRSGLAVNLGVYIGFNSVWSAVVGAADRRPTDADIAKMRAMIVDGLE